MFMLGIFIMICLLLSSAVILISLILSFSKMSDYEKTSPFECGFIPHSANRSFFSLHFFSISILFLVFDVELVLLFPLLLKTETMLTNSPIISLFFIILALGALWEWSQKILKWSE